MAVSSMLAAKKIILLTFPSLIIILFTLFLGRAFCGWICPMGTLLDGVGHFISPGDKVYSLRQVKYILLFVIIFASLFGMQLAGFFDPFSILVRGLAFSVDPVLNAVVSSFFSGIYLHGPEWLSSLTEPVYAFFKLTLLPFKQSFFSLSLVSFVILFTIVFLEKLDRRFWCRNLCPLGALLALVARFSLFNRFPSRLCTDCGQCADECRMDVFDSNGKTVSGECVLCMDCISECEESISGIRYMPMKQGVGLNISRRVFVSSALAGMALPALSSVHILQVSKDQYLLRPPGALAEDSFSDTCVRCGECMKVCIQNGLQPLFLENGYADMFTPRLIPRIGYCEFNCTLCGQVCPTGAIKRLPLEEKHKTVIGKAYINRDRCLPFAANTSCIVCEEHCPVYDKAIKYEEAVIRDSGGVLISLKRPIVIKDQCVGCGICEKKCPVNGESAIRVVREE